MHAKLRVGIPDADFYYSFTTVGVFKRKTTPRGSGGLSNGRLLKTKWKLMVPGGGIYSLRFPGLKKNTSNIGKVQY